MYSFVHLTIVVVSIYKTYSVHIRVKKKPKQTEMVDVYSLFVREYLQIYGENEIILKSSFLQIIHLIMNYFNIILSLTSLYLHYI
jgi:hypothetical protein